MQTNLHPDIIATDVGKEADRILRACVHCGFCTATCPTYQVLGDELDGPRGRIYLIKEMLESGEADPSIRPHLDRCLTCRACETACPSGVEYGALIDIGRGFLQERVDAPRRRRWLTMALRTVVPRPRLFGLLLAVGQRVRRVLPNSIRAHVPPRQRLLPVTPVKSDSATRRVLVLDGCVQRAATPNVNRALENLLAMHDIEVVRAAGEGCCGALDYHLGEHEPGRARMRALIDQLLPHLDDVDAIVSTASGCGVTIKEYPAALRHDAEYLPRAERLAAACVDASELLAPLTFAAAPLRVACHTPCTLQHGQRLPGYERILRDAGLTIVAVDEPHLCCGSAGTYSILEPALSTTLRDRKRKALGLEGPDVIVTANVGCQVHLDGADIPVVHWLELLADRVLSRRESRR